MAAREPYHDEGLFVVLVSPPLSQPHDGYLRLSVGVGIVRGTGQEALSDRFQLKSSRLRVLEFRV